MATDRDGPTPHSDDEARLADLADALGDPPRSLPPGLLVRLRLGVVALIGAAVFGFGMIFWWIFAEPSLPFEDWELDSHGADARGSASAVERTGIREDHSQILRFRFTFRTPQGRVVKGVCHASGAGPKPGADVIVQHLPDRPDVCRIKGLRRGLCSPWAALIGVVPLAGLAAFMIGMMIGRMRINILRNGRVARLTLRSVHNTLTRINNQRVKRYVFDTPDALDDGSETVCRTHLPIGLEPGRQAWVVYDPNRPAKGLFLKLLADGLSVDGFGALSHPVRVQEVLRLLVPAVCIIPHVAIWVARTF